MQPDDIHPINNHHLVEMEDRNHGRIIHLGSKRSIASARYGVCLRSDRYQGERVLCAHGGIPIDGERALFLVPGRAIIRVGEQLQEPYIQIQPTESALGGRFYIPETYFSGWYRVIDTFPKADLSIGADVVPIYGEPRLEMDDDTEYVHFNAIGVVKC